MVSLLLASDILQENIERPSTAHRLFILSGVVQRELGPFRGIQPSYSNYGAYFEGGLEGIRGFRNEAMDFKLSRFAVAQTCCVIFQGHNHRRCIKSNVVVPPPLNFARNLLATSFIQQITVEE